MTESTGLDLTDPDTYAAGIPHDIFRALREREPISRQRSAAGSPYWAVTRYRDAVTVLRNPQLFSSWRGSVLLEDPPPQLLSMLRESMMNKDPPEHTRLRRVMSKALGPRRIAQLEAAITTHAREVIARVRDAKRCDFANDIAEEMPLHLICEILGVPEADRRTLYGLTVRMFSTEIVDPAAAMQDKFAAVAEMRAYGGALRKMKIERPADDLASELVHADVDGGPLTEREFEALFMLLFNGGTDTTRAVLCLGLNLLLERPDIMARLRADLSLLPRAVEEIMRFETPVIQIRRTATADTVLEGKQINEGDKVVVFFPSANRDGAVFNDPDRFDIERTPNDHIAFGIGIHFCLGAPLARLEARSLFHELLTSLTHIERAGQPQTLRTNFVRGMRTLPISYR